MNVNLSSYPQLQSALIQSKPIVYLCGTGLSMALGSHKYSWPNWIAAASQYIPTFDSVELKNLLDSPKEDALITAAGYAIQKTKQNRTYNDYMNATIGSIAVKDNSLVAVLQSVNRAGDFIATTNYDLLIEQATGLDAYTYAQAGNILKSLKGETDRRVIHLHGLYDDNRGIDDIIADSSQYSAIVSHLGVQFVQNLLSTNIIIVIGCGSTMNDPNLSGFLSFAQKQLDISIPYFYLYKGDANNRDIKLPGNFIPIAYGDDYSNLSGFLNEIALYRLNHLASSNVIRINPYVDYGKKGSAYGRLHFSNEFSQFAGRKEELQRLDKFISYGQKLCWWAVTGEGGFGKSRLLLEWLKQLPNNWFGFFIETSQESVLKCQKFRPFNNTIIVLDYILGNEIACAKIISTMFTIFEKSQYSLRIVIVDRYYNEDKIGWYDTLLSELNPESKLKFLDWCYTGEKLIPLKVAKLLECDEHHHVENYLKSYIELLDDTTKNKYKNCLAKTAQTIHKKFCSSLNDKYHRPLFFNIFVEIWVSKDGETDVQNVRDLLGQFLEKETQRWSLRLGEDNELLYAYQILLAFAAASQYYVLQDEIGVYQGYSNRLLDFVNSEKVAGKRKKSLEDLSMYQEYSQNKNENGIPILLTVLVPKYPDIILEFIVDYYVDREYWTIFAQEVRYYENVWFNTFLVKGMEDFPDTDSFLEMFFAPLRDPKDSFGFLIGCLLHTREFSQKGKIPLMVETLKKASMSKELGIYELELWRRIAVSCSEQEEYQELYNVGIEFVNYVRKRKNIFPIIENTPEVIEAFTTILLNAKQFVLFENLLNLFNSIAYDAYIRTACSEAHYYFIHHKLNYKNTENIIKHLENILLYLRKHPRDEGIIKYFINATDEIWNYINKDDSGGLLYELVPIVEQAYDCSKSEQIGEVLAVLEASRFAYSVEAGKQRLIEKSRKRVDNLFQAYSDNEDVTLSYAIVTSSLYIEEPQYISDKNLEQFKTWKSRYPERADFLESYGKVLLVRWFNFKDKHDEECVRETFKEIKAVAKILADEHSSYELLSTTIELEKIEKLAKLL